MPADRPDEVSTVWRRVTAAPGHAPRGLESLAARCLRAKPDDVRLGDLSERYVLMHRRVSARVGTAAWAMAVSRLAADVHYLAATANVVLFARAIDPALRLAENAGQVPVVIVDLRERTMNRLRVAAGKLVLPGLLLVGSALLLNGAIDFWSSWRQTEALVVRLQFEKAQAAADRIGQDFASLRSHLALVADQQWATAPTEERRIALLRLLRQARAIREVVQLDSTGKEVLKVSRLVVDRVNSGADFSADARFTEALARGAHTSPVYFCNRSEPCVSLSFNNKSGVTLAEIDIKALWQVIGAIQIGETGYAYAVDGRGRLIAHSDTGLVRRLPDLSAAPQVAAALAGSPSGKPVDGQAFDSSRSGTSVVSVHAAVPTLDWRVFVDLPIREARAPLWSALIRIACMLALALVAACLAIVLSTRHAAQAKPAVA
jgi:hypothetical protein